MIQTWEEKLETSEDKNTIKLKGRKGVDKWDFSDRFYAILHQIPKCFDKDETKKTRLIEINLDEANAPNDLWTPTDLRNWLQTRKLALDTAKRVNSTKQSLITSWLRPRTTN